MPNAPLLMIALFCTSLTAGAAVLQDPPSQGRRPVNPDAAQRQQAPPRPEQVAEVRLVADTQRIEAGETFHLAVIFELAPRWHIYWVNPGDSGAATEIEVTAPEGFKVGPTLFPRPSTFQEGQGTTYGYEGRAVLFVPVTAPQELDSSTVSFSAEVFYFVCSDICLMDAVEREVQVAVQNHQSSPVGEQRSADEERLAHERQRLPRELDALEGAQVRVEGDRIVITGPLAGHESVRFFPVHTDGIQFGQTRMDRSGEQFMLTIDIARGESNGQVEEARGLIGLGKGPDDPAYWLTLPVAMKKEGAS